MNHTVRRVALSALQGILFIAANTLVCYGQSFTANLSGIVADPKEAVLPGVTVTLKNTATAETRLAISGGDGRYTFSQVQPGTYDLTAELAGFKTFKQLGVTLRANTSVALNFTMQLGERTETVEVTAAPLLLDTESATQSTTLTNRMVKDLPTNVRSPFALVLTLASATTGIFGLPTATVDQNYSGFSLNGSRSMGSQILLDGAPALAPDWGGLIVSPSVDSVQEMQVIQNAYDAQFSKSGGGIVNVVSKGGSSEFHGTLFEFLRSENLDAVSWSRNRFTVCPPGLTAAECSKLKKGELKRHQFGGNLGGPLWPSKRLFFFASYEGLRQTTPGSSGVRTVPTELERQGDFSQTFNPNGTLATIYNPFTAGPDPGDPARLIREPFPGNKIPASLIDPVGAKVAALFPKANRAGDPVTNANNYFQTGSGKVVSDKVDARVDWARSAKYRLFGRFSGRVRQNEEVPRFYGNGADIEKSSRNPGWHISIDNTWTPNPTSVVSVLLGSSRWVEEQISASLGVLTPSSIGLDDSQYQAPLLPAFQAAGYATLGDTFSNKVRKFPRYMNTLQVNASKELKSHSLKFGFWGESGLINNVDRFSGLFTFGRGFTSGPVAATDSSTTGNSIASLLVGTPGFGQSPFQADIAGSMRYYAGYFQDTWRLNKSLTLILGLRYEIQPAATERFNRLSFFDPDAANPLGQRVGLALKGGFRYASADKRGAWETDKSDWAPRFGLAYKIADKLVLRAGFGIFYVPASALITFDHPGQHLGFSTNTTMVSSVGGGGLIPLNPLRNPFPQGLNQPTGSSKGLETALGEFVGQAWPAGPHPTGYKQNFSLDFQYEITPGTVLELGYTGYRARKLAFGNPNLNPNQLPTTFLSLGSALDQLVPNPFFGQITSGVLSGKTVPQHRLLRPFPQFDGISWTRSLPGARNNYDAMTVRFTRQFSHGLTLLSSYQWSKNLDDASEDQGWAVPTAWRDYNNRKLEYSVSAHDVPQSFVTNLVYELPVGQGRRLASNMRGVGQQILGGWQLSTIVRLQSGFPVTVSAPNALSVYGFPRQNPDVAGSELVNLSKRTPERWFNTCTQLADGSRSNCAGPDEPIAWRQVSNPFTLGNAPRYLSNLRSDYTRNVDMTMAKYFPIGEQRRLQFRAEFFNLFNTPQFGSPGSFLTGSTFGQNLDTRNLPRNIQLALKFDF